MFGGGNMMDEDKHIWSKLTLLGCDLDEVSVGWHCRIM
jgi:hypothetical protein